MKISNALLLTTMTAGLLISACSESARQGPVAGDLAANKSASDDRMFMPPEPEMVLSIDDPRATPQDGEPYAMFFKKYGTNPFIDSEDDKLSTFAVDTDTGSYTVCRSYLNRGNLPPDEAPRVEEFVNYFDYNYEQPAASDTFQIAMDIAPSKFGADLKNCHLLRIGMQAKTIDPENRKPAVLTFVIDVSGSMNGPEHIGLVKKSLRLLVKQLKSNDKVGIAVYGSRGRSVLKHTHNKEAIIDALDRLNSDGSTYAEEGIRIGYEMASEAFVEGSINRVILCSDGVANVGPTDHKTILENIAKHRRKGITLSTVGFGMGNYNDTLMEQLGNKGDGRYAYVDSLVEAKRVFVDNLTGALQVVARDTKVQVEFNPEVVKSWRLLGYENRDVADEDFRNDSVDGGEVGSGHSVTALYEVKLFENKTGNIAKATIRYKHDELKEFLEVNQSVGTRNIAKWEETPANYRLAATAAEFSELLRKSYWAKGGSYADLLKEAKAVIQLTDESDVFELTQLIVKAKEIDALKTPTAGGE
ncbi:MAG: von Willebrand factor type A domain-containing protein [Planctomycetes bacterium]|nr:von Willebrand factor type A domain-containing protein [Planctomycetota bacterium]